MKFTLRLDSPCSENWHLMTDTETGKHCQSCQKDLVDFTHLSDNAIFNLVNSGHQVCGRFSKEQLESNFESTKTKALAKAGVIASFTSLLAFVSPVKAQSEVNLTNVIVEESDCSSWGQKNTPKIVSDSILIKGMVFSLDDGPMPFVKVTINDTIAMAITDFDGEFELNLSENVFAKKVILKVDFIGFERKEIVLSKNSSELKIDMTELAHTTIGIICVEYIEPTKFQKFTDFFRRKTKKKYVSPYRKIEI